jgi:hypothetical protein
MPKNYVLSMGISLEVIVLILLIKKDFKKGG